MEKLIITLKDKLENSKSKNPVIKILLYTVKVVLKLSSRLRKSKKQKGSDDSSLEVKLTCAEKAINELHSHTSFVSTSSNISNTSIGICSRSMKLDSPSAKITDLEPFQAIECFSTLSLIESNFACSPKLDKLLVHGSSNRSLCDDTELESTVSSSSANSTSTLKNKRTKKININKLRISNILNNEQDFSNKEQTELLSNFDTLNANDKIMFSRILSRIQSKQQPGVSLLIFFYNNTIYQPCFLFIQ
jgi:hypothetical protein